MRQEIFPLVIAVFHICRQRLKVILQRILSFCGSLTANIACLHDQNKNGFLEDRLLSSQSELIQCFLKCS